MIDRPTTGWCRPICGPFAVDLEHVADCSFTEFWRTYFFTGDGPQKRTFKVRRRLEPTVVNPKPRLPRKLLTSKDPQERQEYCRVQLLLHRPFLNRDDYDGFMVEHHGDFVAAYEGWAKSDSHAPACVTDDFRELHLEVDGTMWTCHCRFGQQGKLRNEHLKSSAWRHRFLLAGRDRWPPMPNRRPPTRATSTANSS